MCLMKLFYSIEIKFHCLSDGRNGEKYERIQRTIRKKLEELKQEFEELKSNVVKDVEKATPKDDFYL